MLPSSWVLKFLSEWSYKLLRGNTCLPWSCRRTTAESTLMSSNGELVHLRPDEIESFSKEEGSSLFTPPSVSLPLLASPPLLSLQPLSLHPSLSFSLLTSSSAFCFFFYTKTKWICSLWFNELLHLLFMMTNSETFLKTYIVHCSIVVTTGKECDVWLPVWLSGRTLCLARLPPVFRHRAHLHLSAAVICLINHGPLSALADGGTHGCQGCVRLRQVNQMVPFELWNDNPQWARQGQTQCALRPATSELSVLYTNYKINNKKRL